jgi:hypothetical protein
MNILMILLLSQGISGSRLGSDASSPQLVFYPCTFEEQERWEFDVLALRVLSVKGLGSMLTGHTVTIQCLSSAPGRILVQLWYSSAMLSECTAIGVTTNLYIYITITGFPGSGSLSLRIYHHCVWGIESTLSPRCFTFWLIVPLYSL